MTQKLNVYIQESVIIEEKLSAEIAAEILYDVYVMLDGSYYKDDFGYITDTLCYTSTDNWTIKKYAVKKRIATTEEIKAYHMIEALGDKVDDVFKKILEGKNIFIEVTKE
jgi:hypothetical protein